MTTARLRAAVLAVLVLLLAGSPTPALVVGTAVVAGLVIAVLELVARPPRPDDAAAPDAPASDAPKAAAPLP